MAVTRLERKGQKNKARAKVRNANLKVVNKQVSVASPNKKESGIVIGNINDVLDTDSKIKKEEKVAQPIKSKATNEIKEQEINKDSSESGASSVSED